MYGLVASQVANAVSGTDVELQKAVDSAAPGSTVTLTGNVVLAKQLSINKTITIDGAGSYSITANFTRTGNDNDSVIGVYGVANTATLNNLVIDAGGSSRDLHGIDPYVSNVIVNDSTIRNARRAAINANGSEVTINNLITSGNRASTWSYGTIDLAKGDGVTREPKLTINGQSIHNDNGTTHIRRLAGTVVDNNEQYSNAFNIRYTLKSAPTAPSFISPTPAQNSTITNSRNVTISWNKPTYATTFEYTLDGGATVKSTNSVQSFTQVFANGEHTVQVRSVAASGLKGNWNTARTFTVNVNNPAEATITTPATNGIVGTQANGNKLNVKGTFKDDKAVNYLQLELVKDGNPVTSYTMHHNDSGLQPDGNFNINMPVSADLADGQYDLIYTANDFEDGIGPRTNHLFYIDNSAPEVKIAHSTGITHEGTLFNPGVFTISATDQGNPPSGLEVISYSVWKYDPSKGTGPYGNGYHQVASNSNKSDSTVAYGTKDLTDGKYFIGYNAGDKVGNSAGGRVDFTIKSPPVAPYDLLFKMSNGGVRSSGGWANLPKGDVTWNHSNPSDVKSYVYYSWTSITDSDWHEGNKWRTPNITSNNLNGVEFNQGEGKYFFCVAAVDALGNESACSETFEIGYDKTAPVVTITKPTGPIDTNKEFTIEGTYKDNLSGVGGLHLYASANGKEVVFYVSALNSTPDDEHNYSYNLTSADLAKLKNDLSLQDGQTLTIKAWAYDKANNWSNTTSTITSDTTAPTAKIESPATGTFVKTANEMEIKLHATDTVGMRWYDVTVWKKDDPRVQGSSPLASWSHEVPASDSKNWPTSFKLANNLNLPDGEYTIYFTATDLLGRYGNAESVNFTVDSIPPKIEIISATPTLIQGTVGSDATKVWVKIGNTEVPASYTPGSTTWSLAVSPALAVGTHNITARAVDAVGNTNTADTDPIWATSSVEVDTPITETPVINSPQTTTPVTPAAILANLTPTPFIPADNTDATDTDDNGAVAGARTNNNGKDSEKGQVLAAEDAKDSWSLINLLLTIGIGAASIITLLGLLGSSRKDRKLASRLLTIVPAAGAVVALLLIEDFSGSMIWVNIWSLLIGALAVIQMIILGMSKPTTNE